MLRAGGPETITIHKIRAGRYRFRVSEYKGPQENGERLKLSGAFVAVYSAGGFLEFEVGQDGFIKVIPVVLCACGPSIAWATLLIVTPA